MELKAGDKVLIESRWNKCIGEVAKVTPKRHIRLTNGSLYDSEGRLKTSDLWNISHISILTNEIVDELVHEKICNEAIKTMNNIKKIDYEKAVKILSILEEN